MKRRGRQGYEGIDGQRGSGESKVQGVRLTPDHFATLDAMIASDECIGDRSVAIRLLIQREQARMNAQ